MLYLYFLFSKRNLLCVCFSIFTLAFAFAQQNYVSGIVTDERNEPLPGVTVLLKGTAVTTTTDGNGRYQLSVGRELLTSDTLEFRYLGFKTTAISYAGSSLINTKLYEDAQTLREVVVTTALGIKRQEKALGYATQTVTSEQLNDARSNNWTSALSGKVAGLTLISPGSGPVNSTRVTLRGNTSLNPDGNFALIVLDGVPVNSGMTSSGVTSSYLAGSGNDVPIDFGNGIADINPDDIESISVLKGASATALYGSRAANGALIITTKSGARKDKGLGVTFNSNVSFNDVLKWPDFQYEYGQGTMSGSVLTPASEKYYSYGNSADGTGNSGTSSAFGPRFNGQSYFQYDPVLQGQSADRVPWRAYEDNVTGFFRTGSTVTNSLAVEGGNDKVSARAGVTHSTNKWIMPNTGYQRLNAAVSLNYNVSEKLKLNSKVNFTNRQSDNLPATGYNNQSISYFMIFQNPNVDLSWYEPRWKNGLDQIDQIHPFSSFIDNPFLIAYEMTNAVDNYKTVGNISATYEFSKNFSAMVRSGLDMSNEDRDQRRPYSTANFRQGYYKQQNIYNFEINTDALLNYKGVVTKNLSVSSSLGGNLRRQRYRGLDRSVEGLVTPGVYKLANGINSPLTRTVYSNKHVNSLYGIVSLDYSGKIFLDLTGRNDWSSTLPVQNNSFFYPSISSSLILSEIFQLPNVISYAKLRLSAAQVGNDTDPYKTSKYYTVSNFASSAVAPTTLFNANFKPEITTSYEGGIEYSLFDGRAGMDVTVYSNTTENQILEVPLDPTTGFTRAVLNAGTVRNTGIELVLNGKPYRSKNFNWNTTITWAKNNNKVLALAEGMNDRQDIGYGGNATLQARVGGSTGDIYGFGFVRSPDGQIVYTAAGLTARDPEIQYIGNAYADWKGGLQNEFSYKNLRFSFLLDGQYGGIVYSQTHHKMSEQGKLKHTLPGREDGYIIGNGVVKNADGSYSPNTTKVSVGTYYGDYYRRANVESNSFDASFLKLREMRLEYNLPKSLISKLKVNRASVAFYGRDLAMITNFPMFDPETAALNGSTVLPGVEIGQMPSTRTFGMNLTLKF